MKNVDLDYTDDAVRRWRELDAGRDLSRFEVGMRIQRLARLLRVEVEVELADLGFSVYGDYEVISTLRRSPAPLQPSELAARLMLTRAGVTGRLDRLTERGLVERRQAEGDGRAVQVKLTTAGRRAADKAFRRIVTTQDRLLSSLDDTHVQALSELLRAIAKSLDPAPDAEGRTELLTDE